jgi:hypothetical protein
MAARVTCLPLPTAPPLVGQVIHRGPILPELPEVGRNGVAGSPASRAPTSSPSSPKPR